MNKNDLDNLLRSRPILLDGGYGFRFAEKGMPDNACPEDWALKHPEILKEIYREYITLYRIAKAEELLLNSDMSITDIALSTGFNDANYFSRAFRKYKEDSPSAYRKKNLLDR
jgi:AraC-like DNA-binding protein